MHPDLSVYMGHSRPRRTAHIHPYRNNPKIAPYFSCIRENIPWECVCWGLSVNGDLILRDDGLQNIAYVMLILAPHIPETKLSGSRPPFDSNDC